jgi:hypothetical protein
MTCPSGPNRAESTYPRPKVTRWNAGTAVVARRASTLTAVTPTTRPAKAAAATRVDRRSRCQRDGETATAGKLWTEAGPRSPPGAGAVSGPPTTSTGTSKRYPRRWQRLHVARGGRLVAQRRADLADAEVQGLLEVDERAFGPHLALDLFTRDELAGPAHEEREDARGLRLETCAHPGLPQLATPRVQLEDAEAETAAPLALHPQQVWLSAHAHPQLSPVLAPARAALCVPRTGHSPHPHAWPASDGAQAGCVLRRPS